MDEFYRDQILMDSLINEIKITKEVNSEHTVKLLESYLGKKFTYMILEICEGDLRKELSSHKFTE